MVTVKEIFATNAGLFALSTENILYMISQNPDGPIYIKVKDPIPVTT